uniref:(northern house mosquito) hypothetical protein n=1 Tax=Culex pipiens TaxID=7175 RepID=A0A8D8F1Y1_CULPI
MPVHSVVVEVVQDGQAVLGGTTLLQLAVVRLGLSDAAVLGPVVLVAHRRRGQLLQLGGPEPAVHHDRLQVRPVAALEVTEPAAGPDVFLLAIDDPLLDPLVFGTGLDGHAVHAPLPAEVARVQPVLFDAGQGRVTPREEVSLAVGSPLVDDPVGAQLRIWGLQDASVRELGHRQADQGCQHNKLLHFGTLVGLPSL